MHILSYINASNLKMLHFAPESFFRAFFSRRFGHYETADLSMKGVDYNVDLQQLPFDDRSYDFVFASHVLEHIPDDEKAISEISRILRPDGIAILPVPIVSENTIEYTEPNPNESYHVRAPGFDYFHRYNPYFSRVEQFSSDSLPYKYQLFTYEDRSVWPSKECPLRPPMLGEKHIDIVPVCYV
jgi:SAM-dependent methyltransferase